MIGQVCARKRGFQKTSVHLQAPAGEDSERLRGMLWARPVMTVTESRLGLLVAGSCECLVALGTQ